MGHSPLLPLVPFGLLLLVLLLQRLRRLPCPPTCRRCGYDVSHRPAGVTLCSECGADLTRRRAILTRRRVRLSSRTRWLAAVLLLIAVVWPANTWRKFDWRTWYLQTAPDRLIAFHAEGVKGRLAQDAFNEWLGRYRADKLPPAERERFFDFLLAWQADTSRAWDPKMGNELLYALAYFHTLSADRGDRFVNNLFVIRALRVRPSIHAGDPVALEYTAVIRGCADRRLHRSFVINGSFRRPPSRCNRDAQAFHTGVGPDYRAAFTAHDAATGELTPGRARLHLLFTREIVLADRSDAHPRFTTLTRQDVDVEIVPPGTPIGRPAPDPALAQAVARSVRVAVVRFKSGQLFANVELAPAPVDRAFKVYVNPAHPLLVTERVAAANESGGPLDPNGYDELLPVEVPGDQRTIQIQLVGTDGALRRSARVTSYWPGTITYTVPISEYEYDRSPTYATAYTVTPASR
jgi:hypothetical protein